MKRLIFFAILFLGALSACGNLPTPTSELLPVRDTPIPFIDGCIPPLTNFAYPVNQRHARSTTQILPAAPWQVEVPLPEKPSGAYAFDLVSVSRTINGQNEVWIRRYLDFKTEGGESILRVQFLVYHTETQEWKLIPEEFDNDSAKSGQVYLAKDGKIWANLGFSGFSYFALYNDKKGQFEYVEESENVPVGNLLLGNDGKFWILASKDGIYSFDTTSHEIERYVSMPDLESSGSLYGSMATVALDGSLYFLNMTGEQQVRLIHFNPETNFFEFVPGLDYLGDISYNLFMDRSGRLWVGDLGWMETNGTWYRIVRSPVFITDKGEGASLIWSQTSIVLESSNGFLWFQSDNGMTWLDPQKEKWCWFTTEKSNIVEDQQQNLWMIADGKLYKYPLNP